MDSIDLYKAVGGRDGCLRLSKTFYTRVKRDPLLRPLFPGKTIKCAVEAFAAFLAQFLGGPAEDAKARWWLSLRESHLRFKIGPNERQAWMSSMIETLEEAPIEPPVRAALRGLFERSSAYLVNSGERVGETTPAEAAEDSIQREISTRWTEQRALDDLVAAIRYGDSGRVLELAQSAVLQRRFERDRAVFAHALGLMMAWGDGALMEFVERELLAGPALAMASNRYGRTLLHDAAAEGNLRMVELLLRLGADPNVGMPGGQTPLYCAGNQCSVPGGGEVVRALVRAGAQVDAVSGAKRCTALHMAARRGNMEVAEALIECGADVHARDSVGVTPLKRAKNCRKAGVASLLAARD
jgi:hemoglobin